MKKTFITIAIAFIAMQSILTGCSVTTDNSRQDTSSSSEVISYVATAKVQEIEHIEMSITNIASESDTQKLISESELLEFVTKEPVIQENESIMVDTTSISAALNEYGLELPIIGATGYTSTSLKLYENESRENVLMTMDAGTSFRIIDEKDDLWYVQVSDITGYVEHLLCMINMPDVIPSIIYQNSNSSSALYRSRGNELEGITGEMLYNAKFFNERFNEEQYAVPVLYSTAKLVCSAQNLALQNGQTLVIYEAFRPQDTQKQVRDQLAALIKANSDVRAHTEESWGQSWFISKSISNHQRGVAIDVSLADVNGATYDSCGDYSYLRITEYEELQMPTVIHELSDDAATFKYPVSSNDKEAWKSVPLAKSMNDAAIMLQFYCTESGMTPLASEWWHFNDLSTKQAIGELAGDGSYFITSMVSTIPD